MKRLVCNGGYLRRYPDDVETLRRVLADMGYDASPSDVAGAYEAYSYGEWAAGWIILPEDDEGLRRVCGELIEKEYLVEVDEQTED